jgi:hypothetical protein
MFAKSVERKAIKKYNGGEGQNSHDAKNLKLAREILAQVRPVKRVFYDVWARIVIGRLGDADEKLRFPVRMPDAY